MNSQLDNEIMRLVITFFIIILISIMILGCSTKTVYVEKPVEVLVPVKCKIIQPEKPKPGINMSESILNIKEYIFQLEAALETCK